MNKKTWQKKVCVGVLLSAALLSFPTPDAIVQASEITYDQVAQDSEKVTPSQVGVEGMIPVTGENVKDGIYDVTVESSSSMFQIVDAKLNVEGGVMTAQLTLSGTGYLKLYMGTGEEAAAADPASYIDYVEDTDGKYTYTVPVEALDQAIPCAAFSKKKEKWYDREILFEAASLPEDALLVELPDYEALEKAAREDRIRALQEENGQEEKSDSTGMTSVAVDLSDGIYQTEVILEGGSGKASITSPTTIEVKDGQLTALVEWSSSHYDYMVVDGEKYLPSEGYDTSAFWIPVESLDQAISVVADTTAMSAPHEITYTLTFSGETEPVEENTSGEAGIWILLILAVCVAAVTGCRRVRNGM